eukprot:TRINITY_DN6180_c0_g1_i2.p1 TRINITY_DN6180_c0_g1~~TRINITY_DN6180_c0_g1_i2.p1  ORF type:complete len:270 (-),score=37.05 TRINITY_DN6180_c0_g1_i2:18-827(-)
MAVNFASIRATLRFFEGDSCNKNYLDINITTAYGLDEGTQIGIEFSGSFYQAHCDYEQIPYSKNSPETLEPLFNPVRCNNYQLNLTLNTTHYQPGDNLMISGLEVLIYDYSELKLLVYANNSKKEEQYQVVTAILEADLTLPTSLEVNTDVITVLEESIYTAIFSVPCYPVLTFDFYIPPFTRGFARCIGLSDCMKPDDRIKMTPYVESLTGISLKFILTGPPNAKALTDGLKVSVQDPQLNGEVFTSFWELPRTVSYTHLTLPTSDLV